MENDLTTSVNDFVNIAALGHLATVLAVIALIVIVMKVYTLPKSR